MLKLLKQIFADNTAGSLGVARVSRVQIATCALLLEMAHTDDEFHRAEAVLIEDLLQQRFSLDAETTAELLSLARSEREASLDLYHFAKEINEHFTIDEKVELVETLWRIVYADGLLDQYEEYLMRQLTKLLRISHRQMIDAKLKVLGEKRAGRVS